MFKTEGVLRRALPPPTPLLKATESAKYNSGLWQDPQLTLESEDKIGSKNNCRPSEIFSDFSSFPRRNEEIKIKRNNAGKRPVRKVLLGIMYSFFKKIRACKLAIILKIRPKQNQF